MAGTKKITDNTKKIFVYTLVPAIVVFLAIMVVLTRPVIMPTPLVQNFQDSPGTSNHSTNVIPDDVSRPNTDIINPTIVPISTGSENKPRIVGKLCLVLDDTGNNMESLKTFLDLDMPFTFAILPMLPYTKQAAELIASDKKDYIIHQPMEASAGDNPGKGAIYNDMTEEQIIGVLEQNYIEQPNALGINNHMGSAVTANLETMNIICRWLESKGLFFMDSYTIADSKAAQAAKNYGMEILKRDIFLDNDKDYQSIKVMLEKSMTLAVKNKKAIAIGHVTSGELAKVLKDFKETFGQKGIELVTLSEYRILP